MTGFENETEILEELNTKKFKDLSTCMQNVILKINNNTSTDDFIAKKYAGINKADINIIIGKKNNFISIKKGTGNSIHQEPIEDFIDYLNTNFKKSESVFNDIRYFIWGDNTLNGKGLIKDRLSSFQFKKKYPEKIQNIQNYFEKYKDALLKRFLITGVKTNNDVDYILYGDINDCFIATKDEILNLASKSKKNPISIGVLTFQAWNRNIKGGNKSEHKRGQIQLKWGMIKNDIKQL